MYNMYNINIKYIFHTILYIYYNIICIYIYSFVYIHLYTLLGGGGSAIDNQKTEDRNSAKRLFVAPQLGMHPPEKNGGLQGPVK